MRTSVIAACFSIVATTATAQVVELGGSVASACLGSDGSLCGNGHRAALAAHFSLWPSDSSELTVRVGRVPLQSIGFNTTFPTPISVAITDRSQGYVSGIFSYHFRRGRSVRPMVGFGWGGIASSEHVRCEPAICAETPGLQPEGDNRTWMHDVIWLAGLSGPIGARWTWRGGVLTHRFLNDENSTVEMVVGLGYRWPAR
jgi:hypothetical protein